jgi:diphosphomevalonate decarboxylase
MEKVDFPLEMMAILLNTEQKKVSSTLGMQHVVETSPYYPAWREVVQADMQKIKLAIEKRDINEIGHIAQTNALRMHALNLAADPGFTYFNAATLQAMHAIDNLRASGTNCYYTMDAGPNVKVIYDRADRSKIQAALTPLFGADNLVVSQPGPGTVLLDQK